MKKIFFSFIILGCIAFLSAETQLPPNVHIFTLENGLQLYFLEDFNSPNIHISYINQAGTKTNDAFYAELYNTLFWNSDIQQTLKKLGAGNFSATIKNYQSEYSFDIGPQTFLESLPLLLQNISIPEFTTDDIEREYTQLFMHEMQKYDNIETIIDAVLEQEIFNAKKINQNNKPNSLNAHNNFDAIRNNLMHIAKTYYIPNKSALFFSGAFSANEVFLAIKNVFSYWQAEFTLAKTPRYITYAKKQEVLIPKILSSNKFSKDFIQILFEFTGEGLNTNGNFFAHAQIIAQILEKKLKTHYGDSIDVSFADDGLRSRIIIQALFQYTEKTVLIDINQFLKILETTINSINTEDINGAKKYFFASYGDYKNNAKRFFAALKHNQTLYTPQTLLNLDTLVHNVTQKNISQVFQNPSFFIFLHPQNITPALKNYTIITDQDIFTQKELNKKNDTSGTLAYKQNKTYLLTLSSNQKLKVNFSNITTRSVLNIVIDGGESVHGAKNRGIEYILIENLAQQLRNRFFVLNQKHKINAVQIETKTDVYQSNIIIEFLSTEIELVLKTINETFTQNTLTPAQADELFFMAKHNWSIKSSDLHYQLYAAAMEVLYANTSLENFFNANTEILEHINFQDLKMANENMMHLRNFSFIALLGKSSHNLAAITNLFEQTFGTQGKQNIVKLKQATPTFSPLEQKVRLRHLFTTDIPAHLAGNRPAKLIPTTDFFDPAHLYIQYPENAKDDMLALQAILYDFSDFLNQSIHDELEAVAVYHEKQYINLRFHKIKSIKGLKKWFKNQTNHYLENIKKEINHSDEWTKSIKSKLYRIQGEKYQTRIQQSLHAENNTLQYNELDKTTGEDFYLLANQLLKAKNAMWFFSADSKK